MPFSRKSKHIVINKTPSWKIWAFSPRFHYRKTTELDFKFRCGRSNNGSYTKAWLPKAPWKADDPNREAALTQTGVILVLT